MAIVVDVSVAAAWCFPDEQAMLPSAHSTSCRGLAAWFRASSDTKFAMCWS